MAEGKTRKQDLDRTYIFRGHRYGPGKAEVPEDFPKGDALPGRRIGPEKTFKPGTSGSGIALEEAPENGIASDGKFVYTQDGKNPGETDEDFKARMGEDAEYRDEVDEEARKANRKAVEDSAKEAKKA